MLAIKSPQMRERLSKPKIQIAKMAMAMTLGTKECWESQIAQIKAETGKDISNGKTYEEMEDFVERQEYDITVKQEHQIYGDYRNATYYRVTPYGKLDTS
jgi:hypothetical protein